MKTACTKLLVVLLFLFLPFVVLGQEETPVEEYGVNIGADIRVDLFSTVTLKPESVEIFQPSTVEIRVVNPDGEPLSNRSVVIVASGVNITQPSSRTDITGKSTGLVSVGIPGAYSICAKDVTFGYDIVIQSCKTLYVVPLTTPTMLPEPAYTKGTSNTVMWQTLGSGYRYTVQASRNAGFTDIVAQGTWISGTSHEFKNLSNGQMYFYRVKARNLYGGESAWSNSVFSVQDSQSPQIEILEIGDVGENNTVKWENDFVVNMKFRVTDNLQLKSTTFSCIRKSGGATDCSDGGSMVGDIFEVNVRLDQLERISGVYLYESYGFCVEADDMAGNVNRVCDIVLNIPKGEIVIPGEEEKPPVVPTEPTVIERIEKGLDDLDVILDNTVGNLDQSNLETVTTTTSLVTVSTAITIAAGTLWEIPYFLMQAVLGLLSWLGFRKKGKPLGFVYDAVTKEPVSQAIVRIFDESKKMVWSDVTDSNGYFNAQLSAGRYRIGVRSSKYSFPSSIVFGKEDYPLSNIYHGEEFDISGGEDIRYAIPMDPLELSKFRLFVESFFGRFKFLLNFLHVVLFVSGLTVSIYAYTLYGGTVNLIILLLFIPSFFLMVRNILRGRGRYGVVTDVEGKRVEGVVVGLREIEFDKIVAKRVTDRLGRYRFVVGKGEYEVVVLETGFRVESVRDGSLVSVKGERESVVARDITVSKLS